MLTFLNVLIILLMGVGIGMGLMGGLWILQDRDNDWANKTKRKYNG